MYTCQKTYGHELGLSACFRQWRAASHCSLIHGYALGFRFTFAAASLDHNGWVMDFGALKPLKQRLTDTFDHKLLVAGDDPELEHLQDLYRRNLAAGFVLPGGVGCEAFAKLAHGYAVEAVRDAGESARVVVTEVECREHAGNSATYYPKRQDD